jgi:triacylglycerol esterase/lipase EstA (alpha/beta hydrolase family)
MKNNQNYKTKSEINVFGQSQGGLIARYIVEECDMHPKVRNLITVGTPNMGFSEIPQGGC